MFSPPGNSESSKERKKESLPPRPLSESNLATDSKNFEMPGRRREHYQGVAAAAAAAAAAQKGEKTKKLLFPLGTLKRKRKRKFKLD
jgi:hypothetical protein